VFHPLAPVNTPNRDETAAKHESICSLGKMCRPEEGRNEAEYKSLMDVRIFTFASKMFKKESVLEKKMPLYRNLDPLHHFP